MKNKAQVALEYLMTYGWALIAILIVVAVLFAIGILSPNPYQGATCRGFGKMGFIDVAASGTNNYFKITLANGSGADIPSGNATLYLDADKDGIYESSVSTTSKWRGSDLYTFEITTAAFNAGERYSVNVKIVFTPRNRLQQEETAMCSGIAS